MKFVGDIWPAFLADDKHDSLEKRRFWSAPRLAVQLSSRIPGNVLMLPRRERDNWASVFSSNRFAR